MPHIGWKLALGIVVTIVVAALLVQRLTRHVPPYSVLASREQIGWGSLESDTAQTLQSILDEEVNQLKVPGLQAFVRTGDGGTWSGTSGTVDLARKIPLQRDHVIRVGSVTKTLTAVMILKLVDEGQLGLDDRLAKWFPNFPRADAITVRQLLNHTSGIPEFLETPDVLMKSIIPSTYWQPQEVLDIAAKREPYFAPGAGWRYSNSNYVLLGLIAEKATSKTTAQLLHGQIIDPLALRHTYFIPYEPAPAMLVPGFDRDLSRFPGLLDIKANNTSWATAAFTSGALASTADDLGVFYENLFAGNLLSPSAMKEMMTFVDASNPGFEPQDGYGLGLMRIKVDGQELIGHVGEFMGSTSIAMYSPDRGYLIVVNTNLSFPNLVEVVARMQESIQ